VVGTSILRKIPFFNLVIHCCINSLHCCWEGVSKQMRKLWMDSQNHTQPWYIGEPSNLAKINGKLKNIQVPLYAITSPY
jgi:hypothetical protein